MHSAGGRFVVNLVPDMGIKFVAVLVEDMEKNTVPDEFPVLSMKIFKRPLAIPEGVFEPLIKNFKQVLYVFPTVNGDKRSCDPAVYFGPFVTERIGKNGEPDIP